MTLHELNAKIQEATIKQIAVQHQFDAILKLYEAATMMDSRPLMEQYRDLPGGRCTLPRATATDQTSA